MKLKNVLTLITVVVAVNLSFASYSNAGTAADPLKDRFVSGDEIFSNIEKVGITDDQRRCVVKELKDVKSMFNVLELELKAAVGKLDSIASEFPVNEGQLLGQLNQVIEIEKKQKIIQVRLLARFKNCLTATQFTQILKDRK